MSRRSIYDKDLVVFMAVGPSKVLAPIIEEADVESGTPRYSSLPAGIRYCQLAATGL